MNSLPLSTYDMKELRSPSKLSINNATDSTQFTEVSINSTTTTTTRRSSITESQELINKPTRISLKINLQKFLFKVHFFFAILLFSIFFVAASILSRKHYNLINGLETSSLLLAKFGSVAVDYTDGQWRQFTSIALPFIPVLFIFVIFSKFARGYGARVLMIYYIIIGLLFIAFLHGPAFCIPLFFIIINYIFVIYFVRYKISYNIFMTVMWILQIGLLLFNNYNKEYFTKKIVPEPPEWWPRRLRWEVVLNMSVLRMIAFNMDFYEATNNGITQQEKAVEKHDSKCVECAQIIEANRGEGLYSTRCYKFRTEYSREIQEYNLLSYLAYMFYVPLYVAGPMSSFNAFISHCHHSTLAFNKGKFFYYGIRGIILYAITTITLHFVFLNAIRDSSYILMMVGSFYSFSMLYIQLVYLWMKFNCIWKIFRLISILDGVDVPEDMRSCFTNIVSIQDFWRDWHASFNLWIVRYMYIPMGGNKKKHLNIFPIFFFIAIWHDVELHLLYWALAMCICIVVELMFMLYISKLPLSIFIYQHFPNFYLFLRAIFSACSHMCIILACVIGFNTQYLGNSTASSTPQLLYYVCTSQLFVLPFFFLYLYCCTYLGLAWRDDNKNKLRQERIRFGISEGRH